MPLTSTELIKRKKGLVNDYDRVNNQRIGANRGLTSTQYEERVNSVLYGSKLAIARGSLVGFISETAFTDFINSNGTNPTLATIVGAASIEAFTNQAPAVGISVITLADGGIVALGPNGQPLGAVNQNGDEIPVPPTINTALMASMAMNVSEPVSFTIGSLYQTDKLIVDWGDGSMDTYSTIFSGFTYSKTVTHTYLVPGNYTILILMPIESSLLDLNIYGTTENKLLSIIFTPIAKQSIFDIQLPNNQLSTIDLSNCSALFVVNLFNNILSVNTVNTILVDLATSLFNNGFLQLEGQTPEAIPNTGPPDGAAALATLLGRDWTITVDGP